MSTAFEVVPANERELTLGRLLAAPPAALWRCWTEAELLRQWFCPKPWFVASAVIDVRPGGTSHVEMRGPDGEQNTHRGVYLEVVPQRKLVFTDAFVSAWEPSERPFISATILFEPEGTGTRYTCRVGHWSVTERENHEKMGFHTGWGIVSDQLEAVAQGLR